MERMKRTIQTLHKLWRAAIGSYASAVDREQAIAAGYDGHVAKPVDPDGLVRAIVQTAKVEKV